MMDRSSERRSFGMLDFPWWECFAFVRSVSLAVLVAIELVYLRETPSDWLFPLLGQVVLVLAVVVNIAVGGIEVVWSLGRALLVVVTQDEPFPAATRHLAAAFVRAMCAVLPVLVFLSCMVFQIPDRSFIWRHREQLEAVVNGGDAGRNGFMDVERVGARTMIHASDPTMITGYWVIHDKRRPQTEELAREVDTRLPVRVIRTEHVYGPWYGCSVD